MNGKPRMRPWSLAATGATFRTLARRVSSLPERGFVACLWSGAIVLGILGTASSAFGQWTLVDGSRSSEFHSITNPNVGATGGVSISLRPLQDISLVGYSRYQFKITPLKGGRFTSSGTLEFELSSAYSQGGKAKVLVKVPIEAGETSAMGEALVCLSEVQYVEVITRLDGRRLEGNSTTLQSNFYGGYNPQKDRILCLLSDESAKVTTPRASAYAKLQPDAPWFIRSKADSNTERSYGKLDSIPENWLELTAFSQISIDAADLLKMQEADLAKLRHYVMAGGVLSVQRMEKRVEVVKKFFRGDQWKNLDLYSSVSSGEKKRTSGTRAYGYLPATQTSDVRWSDFAVPTYDLLPSTLWDEYWTIRVNAAQLEAEGTTYFPNRSTFGMSRLNPVIREDWFQNYLLPETKELSLAYLDYELMFFNTWYSQLRAFSDSSLEESDASDAVGPLNIRFGFGLVSLPDSRRIADDVSVASGTANHAERFAAGIGNEFWDWLIPSVGKTPAFAFLAFVGLFVGGVAPGLMFWSNRKGRRVWLLLLMPAMAIVSTASLFAFGILKDGFASESRIRSVTFLDGKEEGLVWSRQSYFTATVPTEGFSVSNTTMVTPLVPTKVDDLPYYTVSERDDRRYYQGLLPPRIQTQFSVMHPSGKIELIKRTDVRDEVLNANQIVNASDKMTWQRAAFINQRGECFISENVSPGSVASFRSESAESTSQFLIAGYNLVPLAAPVDAPNVDQRSLGSMFFGYRRWGGGRATGDFAEELLWRQKLGASIPGASVPTPQTTFSPGSFVLFVDKAPHVEKCLNTAKESDGLHVIFGRWER